MSTVLDEARVVEDVLGGGRQGAAERERGQHDEHHRRAPLLAGMLAWPTLIQAAEPAAAPQTLQRVEISDKPSDEAKNRNAVAGKIILGRAEIERLGDSRAGDGGHGGS
mgnify:CR=1 FL=1